MKILPPLTSLINNLKWVPKSIMSASNTIFLLLIRAILVPINRLIYSGLKNLMLKMMIMLAGQPKVMNLSVVKIKKQKNIPNCNLMKKINILTFQTPPPIFGTMSSQNYQKIKN